MKRNPEFTHNGCAILRAGPWMPRGGGLQARRIVLVEWDPNKKWSTHLQTEDALYFGHYFHAGDNSSDLMDAAQDWEVRDRAERRADRHCSQAEEMS
jgi:hypothetical protein